MTQGIEGVIEKKLKLIADERGWLMEMLRNDDPHFTGFGQVYCTAVYPGVVKGWHAHRKQSDNIVCVSGMIKLVLWDSRTDSPTHGAVQEFFMGERNPILVHVPSMVYHGWKCISPGTALAINAPDRPYDYADPDEIRIDPHDNDIPYDWSRKDE